MKRLLQANVGFGLIAAVVCAAWIRAVGGLAGLRDASPILIAAMLGLTAMSVVTRFLRWQFLMRHAGSRMTERPSLLIYLASLVGTATPAYIGEAVRGAFVRRQFGVPFRTSVFVLVVERLMDVCALALLAGATAHAWWARGVMLLILAGAVAAMAVAMRVARAAGAPESVLRIVRRRDIVVDALGLSIVAWVLTGFHVSLAAWALNGSISPLESVRVFASSTLFGGLTLMPAGIAATGSLAILELQNMGFALSSAVDIVSLVRLTTAAATLAAGTICLIALWRATRRAPAADAAVHFDEIATEYGEQFRPHVWNYLLDRKVEMMAGALSARGAGQRGLDLGCGLGQQCLAMEKRGHRMFGMEIACKLAARARKAGANVAAGSAMSLPFRDGSLDFVYAIGVLHHLPDREAQQMAYREIARVLKPGGLLLVHETNTRNPLFRFYMGYVFPLLKKIDEGTEWWIEPDRWKAVAGLRPVSVRHFTFMPDFIPTWLMKPVLAVDHWLESTRLRCYSVHYMAVLARDASWVPPAVPKKFVDVPAPSHGWAPKAIGH